MNVTKITRGQLAALSVAIGLTAAAPSQGVAKDINYSLGLGPGSAVALAAEDYAKAVNGAGADLRIKVFPLELVSLPEMGPGIRDGLTDMGYMAAPYYAAEFAHTNFLAELSMLQTTMPQTGKEDLAYAGAMTEYVMTKCPTCLDEFKAQNHVYMGHIASSPYYLLCNKPVTNATDMKGKRLRAGGASFKRFAEHFGAVGVQMPSSEAYEALSQGVLDCAILSVPELTNIQLMEIVKAITLGIPGNVYGGTVAGNFNRDVWNGLSTAQRKTLLEHGANLSAGITWNYHASHKTDLEKAKQKGIQLIEPGPEFKAAMSQFVNKDMETVADIFKNNYKVADSKRMFSEFRPLLERWSGLVANVNDAKSLGQLYYTEVFSKLDPATYGVD